MHLFRCKKNKTFRDSLLLQNKCCFDLRAYRTTKLCVVYDKFECKFCAEKKTFVLIIFNSKKKFTRFNSVRFSVGSKLLINLHSNLLAHKFYVVVSV